MEIFILLKANFRHKKGAFVSIILLMIIISMSLTVILSVQNNCSSSIENAMKEAEAGDLLATIKTERLTEELLDSVKNHSMVEKVAAYPAIVCDKAETGGNVDSNTWFLVKLRSNYKLFNSDLTAYEKEMPALNPGEIYITQGIMTKLECKAGDEIKLSTIGGDYLFKIKGIFVEPMLGSSTIGWKQVFVSDEDFDQMYLDSKKEETEDMSADFHVVQIYKAKDCALSDSQFRRQLNLDTGFIDQCPGTMTQELSAHYTELFMDIVLSCLMVFILFLFLIVLIVLGHNISTGIEMDYKNLGVLKAQGFTKGKIRMIWVLQYFFAQIAGAVCGMILAVPLVYWLGNVFQPITGILANKSISLLESLLSIMVILLFSALFVFWITKKISKVSPVRAIQGGRSEIYFDSRIKAPICKKGLLASLALRQFTASKRRYIGTIIIVSILVFFMLTITVLGNVLDSKSALEAMGTICTECDISFKEKVTDEILEEMEEIVEKYSPVEKKYYMSTMYCSINGEEVYCQVYKNPEVITAVRGRAPIYDNEIIVTEILAKELELTMGDKVMVGYNDSKSEYVISGIFQSINDTGMTFAMSAEGAEKLGIDTIIFAGYSLSKPEKGVQIADALNAEFGDILEAKAITNGGVLNDTYTVAINAMKAVIYIISILFALVVVMMVCSKLFLQEKNDIGIYKALGFTAANLRLQFAVRFFIIAVAGSALGLLLSVFFSGTLLGSILWAMGVTSFAVRFTPLTLIMPVVLICGCFFLFAYLVSWKIKRIEVRELVAD